MTVSSATVMVQGFALRVIREARGRKIAELARAVEVDRSYLTKIETGAVARISSVVYSALLRELAITDYRALLANPPVRDPASSTSEPVEAAAS